MRGSPAVWMVTVVTLAAAVALAHPPVGIVVDPGGNVYYSDLAQVWRIDPRGRKSVAVPDVHTHELYLADDGALFGEHLWYEGEATDRWGYRVWRRSADGRLNDVIPSTVGFRLGYSFVRDGRGNMYYPDPPWVKPGQPQVVRRRNPEGAVATVAGGFGDIRWMAAKPDGTLYVVDGTQLRQVSPGGEVRALGANLAATFLGSAMGGKHTLMGLWPDPDGSVFVANPGGRRLLKIAADGGVTVFCRSPLPYHPVGVTATPDAVYVLESAVRTVRVRKFTRDGKQLARY
jgi:hypothetical protein